MVPGPNNTAESIINQIRIKFPKPLLDSEAAKQANRHFASDTNSVTPANWQSPQLLAATSAPNAQSSRAIAPAVTPAFKTQMQNPHKRIKVTTTTPVVIDQNSPLTVNNSATTAAAPLSIEDRLAQLESRMLLLEAKNAVLEANNAQMKEQLLTLVAEKSACRM